MRGPVAGTEPGKRQLNGPQTSGREYRNLSKPEYSMERDDDVAAPAGFIEAGASDYFVPCGYVHVIANLRGTSGSGGTFGFFDGQERRDMYDLVEWAGVIVAAVMSRSGFFSRTHHAG